MPKFFVKQEQIEDDRILINGQDVNHIKNVLRSKIGEELEICNYSTQQNYICSIEQIQKECIICKILQNVVDNIESNVKVTIFQGLPKADKMELIIQKSVELGVFNIVPVEMTRCIVKINEKDKTKKIERWQKISEVAAKQCGRNIIPKIEQITTISNISELIINYDVVLVAYENEKENTLKSILNKIKNNETLKIGIIIGPEGGLELEEVKMLENKGAKVITLGKRILRTETVAFNMLSVIMYEFEN